MEPVEKRTLESSSEGEQKTFLRTAKRLKSSTDGEKIEAVDNYTLTNSPPPFSKGTASKQSTRDKNTLEKNKTSAIALSLETASTASYTSDQVQALSEQPFTELKRLTGSIVDFIMDSGGRYMLRGIITPEGIPIIIDKTNIKLSKTTNISLRWHAEAASFLHNIPIVITHHSGSAVHLGSMGQFATSSKRIDAYGVLHQMAKSRSVYSTAKQLKKLIEGCDAVVSDEELSKVTPGEPYVFFKEDFQSRKAPPPSNGEKQIVEESVGTDFDQGPPLVQDAAPSQHNGDPVGESIWQFGISGSERISFDDTRHNFTNDEMQGLKPSGFPLLCQIVDGVPWEFRFPKPETATTVNPIVGIITRTGVPIIIHCVESDAPPTSSVECIRLQRLRKLLDVGQVIFVVVMEKLKTVHVGLFESAKDSKPLLFINQHGSFNGLQIHRMLFTFIPAIRTAIENCKLRLPPTPPMVVSCPQIFTIDLAALIRCEHSQILIEECDNSELIPWEILQFTTSDEDGGDLKGMERFKNRKATIRDFSTQYGLKCWFYTKIDAPCSGFVSPNGTIVALYVKAFGREIRLPRGIQRLAGRQDRTVIVAIGCSNRQKLVLTTTAVNDTMLWPDSGESERKEEAIQLRTGQSLSFPSTSTAVYSMTELLNVITLVPNALTLADITGRYSPEGYLFVDHLYENPNDSAVYTPPRPPSPATIGGLRDHNESFLAAHPEISLPKFYKPCSVVGCPDVCDTKTARIIMWLSIREGTLYLETTCLAHALEASRARYSLRMAREGCSYSLSCNNSVLFSFGGLCQPHRKSINAYRLKRRTKRVDLNFMLEYISKNKKQLSERLDGDLKPYVDAIVADEVYYADAEGSSALLMYQFSVIRGGEDVIDWFSTKRDSLKRKHLALEMLKKIPDNAIIGHQNFTEAQWIPEFFAAAGIEINKTWKFLDFLPFYRQLFSGLPRELKSCSLEALGACFLTVRDDEFLMNHDAKMDTRMNRKINIRLVKKIKSSDDNVAIVSAFETLDRWIIKGDGTNDEALELYECSEIYEKDAPDTFIFNLH